MNGKSVTETFSTPAALRKAQQEVEEFHRFRQLSHGLLEVNEMICKLRPVEDTLTARDADRHKTGTIDLEVLEMLVLDAMHRAGAMTV